MLTTSLTFRMYWLLQWGLLYTPQNTSAPKYQGALQRLLLSGGAQSGVKR